MAGGDITAGSLALGSMAGMRTWAAEVETDGVSTFTVVTGFSRILGAWATFSEVPDNGTTSLIYVSSVSGGTVTFDGAAASGSKTAYIFILGI
jgi:hypothetical protein